MKQKSVLILLMVFLLGSSLVYAKNAYWKNNRITVNPKFFYAGHTVKFKAIINIDAYEMQNIRVKAGVDKEVYFDKILYYFQRNVDYPYEFEWKAEAGTHTVFFELEATDSISPDDNPDDNRVTRRITVSQLTSPLTPPRGTPTKKKPGTLSTQTKANIKFLPCTQYQNEPTDLKVVYFQVRSKGTNEWEYEARIVNDGRRCVKAVFYKVTNGNNILAQNRIGNPSDPHFILPENGVFTVKKTFTHSGNFETFTQGSSEFVRFTFELDYPEDIPDPDRDNNKAHRDILKTW
jgi:hypothetical protein